MNKLSRNGGAIHRDYTPKRQGQRSGVASIKSIATRIFTGLGRCLFKEQTR